jgi:hypothetical protein
MVGLHKVDTEDYFADPCEVPSYSQSCATTLLKLSPKHAWAEHPKLGGTRRRKKTREMDHGSLMHSLVLGTGKAIEVVDAKDFKTKAAKAAKAEAEEAGKVAVVTSTYERAEAAAARLTAGLGEWGIDLRAGEVEIGVFWVEETLSGPIQCRGMIDALQLPTIWDLKTKAVAHPEACGRSLGDYGEEIQLAAYTSAISKLHPELAGRVKFRWIFAEKEEPFAFTVGDPDGLTEHLGEQRWRRACEIWARCLKTDRWPSYADGPVRVGMPEWKMREEMTAND